MVANVTSTLPAQHTITGVCTTAYNTASSHLNLGIIRSHLQHM